MVMAAGLMMAMALGATADKTSPSFILGGQIADAARIAERAGKGQVAQDAVTTAAQRVITVSGHKPAVVQVALETVLAECAVKLRSDTAHSRGYTCHGSEEAEVAIEKLLVVVRRLAMLELAPSQGSGDGIGNLGAPPGGGGGADYSAIPR